MPTPPARFLGSPAKIRAAVVALTAEATGVDLAVAFVGADWNAILGAIDNPIRLVCWLSSTNTNPMAVRQLRMRKNVAIRQMDRMHAKVYIGHGPAGSSVVGSANLSVSALAEDDGVGQVEAAILVRNPATNVKIAAWFEALWADAASIEDADIAAAIVAWLAAHKGSKGGAKKGSKGKVAKGLTLAQLADAVRDLDIESWPSFEAEYSFVGKLDGSKLTTKQLKKTVGFLVKWQGYDYAYAPAFEHPIAGVRAAFVTAFDEGRGVAERLADLADGGSAKLPGLGLASWSLILQWRAPHEYPPFNKRTRKFLTDFGLAPEIRDRPLTPEIYDAWLAFAQELALSLDLPACGYVDRMVWEYTKPKDA